MYQFLDGFEDELGLEPQVNGGDATRNGLLDIVTKIAGGAKRNKRAPVQTANEGFGGFGGGGYDDLGFDDLGAWNAGPAAPPQTGARGPSIASLFEEIAQNSPMPFARKDGGFLGATGRRQQDAADMDVWRQGMEITDDDMQAALAAVNPSAIQFTQRSNSVAARRKAREEQRRQAAFAQLMRNERDALALDDENNAPLDFLSEMSPNELAARQRKNEKEIKRLERIYSRTIEKSKTADEELNFARNRRKHFDKTPTLNSRIGYGKIWHEGKDFVTDKTRQYLKENGYDLEDVVGGALTGVGGGAALAKKEVRDLVAKHGVQKAKEIIKNSGVLEKGLTGKLYNVGKLASKAGAAAYNGIVAPAIAIDYLGRLSQDGIVASHERQSEVFHDMSDGQRQHLSDLRAEQRAINSMLKK